MQQKSISLEIRKQPITTIGRLNLKNKKKIKAHKTGVVYAFTPENAELTKIGYSTKPEERIEALLRSSGLPENYSFDFIKSKSCFWLEQEIHAQLDEIRLNRSEWFRISHSNAMEVIREVSQGIAPLIEVSTRDEASRRGKDQYIENLKEEIHSHSRRRAAILVMYRLIQEQKVNQNIASSLITLSSEYGDFGFGSCWRMTENEAAPLIECGFLELLSPDDFGKYLVRWSFSVASAFNGQVEFEYMQEVM